MRKLIGLLRYPVKWMGGWVPFLGLVVLVVAVVIGLRWERSRGAPLPPGAQNVASDINTGALRQTSFRVAASIADVRAFYRQELPRRGWRHCGTQATARCTNLIDATGDQVDVYRRDGDNDFTGPTIEVWPVRNEGGVTYVTIFETGAE